LQRLDGPSEKIIQELEAASEVLLNVIKVIWGTDWDPLWTKIPRQTCQEND
jgi:pyruvate dehydrogenase complex dehydrogenase (E1) component